jgi:hypothetical protein
MDLDTRRLPICWLHEATCQRSTRLLRFPRRYLSLMVSEVDLTHTKLPQIEWAMYLICIPALGCIKLSVLFFYHRIFCPQKIGLARIFIIMMMCIVVLWAVGFWFANLLACKGNFSAWWGSPVDLITKCVKTLELTYSLSITDFITDAIVLLIPLPLVRLMRHSICRLH